MKSRARQARGAIRVLLVDDLALVREGLRKLLEGCAEVRVVGEAGDGDEALERAKAARPDVVLVELEPTARNWLEVARRLQREVPGCRVLMLTMHGDDAHVLEALRAGVDGYIVKRSGVETVVEAIRRVHAGELYIGPGVNRAVLEEAGREEAGKDGGSKPLTQRERQVLELVADGRTNRQAAEQLGISVKTVQTHRANLMNKLGIHNQTLLVKYAIRLGLVGLE
jgi:DNA-binding NarL/FixJ family response regulator